MSYWTRLKCFSGPLGVKPGGNLFCFTSWNLFGKCLMFAHCVTFIPPSPPPSPNPVLNDVRISSAISRQQKYRVERINGFFVAFWLSSFDSTIKCGSKGLLCFWVPSASHFNSKPEELPLGGLLVAKLLLRNTD